MTLVELITAQSARLKQAGVSFGHGTTNAFDEAAWLVLWALGIGFDEFEAKAQRPASDDDAKKAKAIVTQRIETRQPAAYLVYLYLSGLAARAKWKPIPASLRTLADATGLSKSAVQTALENLRRRQLIKTASDHPTDTPRHQVLRHWRR